MSSGSVSAEDQAVRFRWGGATDVGRVRRVNQDRFLVRDGLFVVADGMGGHQGGETASRLAIEAVGDTFGDGDLRSLVASIRAANQAILAEADADADLAGMGTTLCALALVEVEVPEATRPTPVVDGDTEPAEADLVATGEAATQLRLAVANVGDSRVYRFSGARFEQVTHDHSLVEELVRAGRLSPDEADDHPQRNILTRALGVGDDLRVDLWELPLRAGDRFLLCSDGLFNEVTDARIAATLRRLDDPGHAAAELVRLANEHGSRDNVTAVVVNVEAGTDDAGGHEPPGPPAVVDLAGFSRAPSATPRAGASDQPVAPRRSRRARPAREDHDEGPRRRLGLGTVGFVAVLLAVIALGAAAVGVYARDNYFVGVDGDELVVFQGRPGGVLWFDPTVSLRTGVATDELTPALLEEVLAEPQFSTVDEAVAYLDSLVERIPAARPRPTPAPGPTPVVTPGPTPTSIAEPRPTPTSIAEPRPTPTSIADGPG